MTDVSKLIYIFYSIIGVVCSGLIGVILNRVRATKYKKTIDSKFCLLLVFFIIYCCFDSIWGLVGFTINDKAPIIYTIVTYLFHIFSAFSAFFISMYATHFLNFKKKYKTIFTVYRFIILAAQIALIVINIFDPTFWFIIDSSGVYHTQSQLIRTIVFSLQFIQYTPITIFAFIYALRRMLKKKSYSIYLSGAFFLVIPLIFGILQLLFPDGPFYSLGFLAFAVAIYSIIVTSQRETFLEEFYVLEEQRKSQAEIEKALNAAREANNAKAYFLANMSHDIRTPINGIMGLTEIMKNEKDPQKIQEYIKKIDTTSHHLLSLVNDVLDMTLIENKKNQLLNIESISIKDVVENCRVIIENQLSTKHISFDVKYENEIENPNIFADELRLRQIFINILGNAIKFTNKGGVYFGIEQVSVADDFVKFRFTFKDTGIGMKEEFIQHLFEPFSQENNNGRSKYQGTGLGMTITKELVDMMKGTIQINSQLGHGTTFIVEIPFKISHEVKEQEKPIEEKADLNGMKCLIVEDNELNMEIATTILETTGLVITKATNGKEAVEAFEKSEPGTFDIILMDIMMPIMDGYEATKIIRKMDRPDANEIPIIAMTANAFDEDKKKATLAGMNGHVAKPLDFNLLERAIISARKK